MSKLIVITSGKGGVGKTTTAINLAAAINYFKKDVLIIDGNLTTPNVGLHLGSPEVPVNLNHVLLEKADPIEAVYEHESGIKIVPSSLSIKELKKIKPEKLKEFKNDFKKIAEYVIVDSAAGLGIEATHAIEMADEIIVVTNPELPAITDALKTVKLAEQMKRPILGIIVTRVKRNNIEMHPDNVKESILLKDAVVHTHPRSNSARAYKEIAARITGKEYDSSIDKPTLWDRWKGRV